MLRRAAVLLLATLAAGSSHAEPRSYRLDPDHSFITFEVLHFGTSTLRGRFGPVSGYVRLDSQAGTGHVGLTIPTARVDTGVPLLDRRLCERDLLGCADHPNAYFVAERFRFDGDAVRELRGELTLHGVSQALTLKAVHYGCHPHPLLQREVCGGDFVAELLRSDFGAAFGVAFVSDRVTLKIQVEGIREP
ncbi:YceI family protein [Ideonella sp. BN130291]|uniref:YceI family protein n=1 Tax=Ideonella sp. BN130291 TaxID=3112940 RepID=UPI002E26D51C|nr:YceI family protein [Ideonella sp. BN130291]